MSPRLVAAALLSLDMAVVGCHDTGAPPPREATLLVRASLAGTAVTSVVIEVSAADIPQTLVFNLTVAGGMATGVVTVPAGSDRVITVRAYDAGGVQTHNGTVTVDVQPNATLTLNFTLDALTGDIALEITLGHVTVTVTPPTAALVVAGTVTLTAAITDEHGATVAGPPKWASANPAAATVDQAGVVTAVAPGTATIAATFGGAAGHATITVTAAPQTP